MSDIEVLEFVIQQIGELRVPVRETELLDGLEVILRNLTALKDAIEQTQNAQKSGDGEEGVKKDV